MSDQTVLFERDGPMARITLNRPDRLNAIDESICQGLMEALETLEHDHDLRVAVITGAGRAFCAGGDIQRMIELKKGFHSANFRSFLEAGHAAVRKIREIPKPIVAAVNGPAAGGGMSLALACDLRIASGNATFTQAFSRLGLHPDWGGTFSLPRMAGMGRALEIFWLGGCMTVEEAQRIGLVNFVVPHESFAKETNQLVLRLAAAPPLPVALLKQVLYERTKTDLERHLENELAAQMKCFESEDFTEGLRAFTEKRDPEFHGK